MTAFTPSMTVICPSGVLNAESAAKFEQELVSAMRASCENEIVVDMSKVESLDNAGLVSFMSALNEARAKSKRLSICSAPPSIRIVFELTQLDRVFTMVEQAPLALAA
ncbi:MAG: STAS domain-containing protein [Cyanobacteria bacterium P01_D01_bin.105]